MDTTESYDSVPLPLYTGRLSSDWSSHQTRLEAWLRFKGIPLHSEEAKECLLLSLRANALLAFETRSEEEQKGRTFEDGVKWLEREFGGKVRKHLAQATAMNRLDTRGFRERGRRKEFISDLTGDLELLFLQAGIVDDEQKRRHFIGCFIEFPRAMRTFSLAESYEAAVTESIRWEAKMVEKERQARQRGYTLSSLTNNVTTSNIPAQQDLEISTVAPSEGPSPIHSSSPYDRFPPPPSPPTRQPPLTVRRPSISPTPTSTSSSSSSTPPTHSRPSNPFPSTTPSLHSSPTSSSRHSISNFRPRLSHSHETFGPSAPPPAPNVASKPFITRFLHPTTRRSALPSTSDWEQQQQRNSSDTSQTPPFVSAALYPSTSHLPDIPPSSPRSPRKLVRTPSIARGGGAISPPTIGETSTTGRKKKGGIGLVARLFSSRRHHRLAEEEREERSPSPSPSETRFGWEDREDAYDEREEGRRAESVMEVGRPAKVRLGGGVV